MTVIIFESHATSEDNARGIASGHRDAPLSDRGKEEARALGARYRGRRVDAVFCSDLSRARDTAAIAFEDSGIPILKDVRLRELDYGEYAGRPRAEVGAERARRINEPFPGGESVAQAAERIRLFLGDIIERNEGETVVIIGHSATHFGLEHWLVGTSLAEIVAAPWVYEPGRSYTVTPEARVRVARGQEPGR